MFFQGEGDVKLNMYCFLNGVDVNPGKQTMYHMCKTWLKRYMVGGYGG